MASADQARMAYMARISRVRTRVQWFDNQVRQNINLSMEKRLDIVAQLLRDKIVANISLSVVREQTGGKIGRVVTRSLPGEFPRAETTHLMKSIFWDRSGKLKRRIGTTLDYGLWLEITMDRSFLRRTLAEEQRHLTHALTRPV